MIKVRQVDAGREQALTAILAVLDGVAAQNRDVGCGIEYGEIGRDFEAIERPLVLGIEKARIAHGNERSLAAPFESRAFEREFSMRLEAASLFEGARMRQQHGVAKMRAAPLVREDVGEKETLVDLGTILVLLPQRILLRKARVIRHQARQDRRGVAHEIFNAFKSCKIIGETPIDGLHMPGEKLRARCSVAFQNRRSSLGSGLRARRLRRQQRKQLRADPPAPRKILSVSAIVTGEGIAACKPRGNSLVRQTRVRKRIRVDLVFVAGDDARSDLHVRTPRHSKLAAVCR